MGVHPDRIAMMTDGIASSHILWPNTADPRNLLNLSLFRSFGRPVVVPIFGLEQERVINDFTSANYRVNRIARRTYEHLGMGVWGLAVGYWKSWGWTLAHHEEAKAEIARLAAELKRLDPELHLMQPVSCPVGFVVAADDAADTGIPGVYMSLYAAALARGLPIEFVYEERLLSNRPPVPRVLVVASAGGLSQPGFAKLRGHLDRDGSALLWPSGEKDWSPSDLAENRRVRIMDAQARPSPAEVVEWLVGQAGPDALPVRYGAGSAGLETFALCDGVNAIAIAINTTDDLLENARCEIARHLTAGRKTRWSALLGEAVKIEGHGVELILPPHGVAVLFGESMVPESWDLSGELARMDRRLASAESDGFDVAGLRDILDEGRGHLAAGRRAKALASLSAVRRTLLVDLNLESGGDTANVRVRVASIGRALPETTEVEVRLPDHGDFRMKLDKAGGNTWTGSLARDGRVSVYDYRTGRYRPDGGAIAVQAEARDGARDGASRVVMWVGRSSR